MFLKRILVGLMLGVVVGGVVGVALVQGLGVSFLGTGGAVLAYLSAAATGVLTGLVAGKPIWAADGKIEAGLKAFFGALLSLGAMFAIRQWLTLSLDLTAFKAGMGQIGELPVVSLPIIAGVLGGFFELDNDAEKAAAKKDQKDAPAKGAKGKPEAKKKAAPAAEEEEEEEEVAEKKGKR